MQILILGLTIPVVPLLLWMQRNKEKVAEKKENLFLRYIVYTLLITLLSTVIMVFMCEEGTSFIEKVDTSTSFALKYVMMEVAIALIISGVEWNLKYRKVAISVDWQQYYQAWPVRFVRKYIFPVGIYLLALLVVILNVRLMFDNVLWGDEAFSANTAHASMSGIMQILYYWDNHPPLHYYWLKLFGEAFGHTVPVYHLASLVPFIVGVFMAITALRKRFGNIPASFFIVITGLASTCLGNNLEVRMYSLAFMGVAACFYSAYRVLCHGKAAWFSMVLWALVAAYSHYYALVVVGILMFITGVAYWVRYRGKTWMKGLLAIVIFIVGYAPWLGFLFTAMENVSNTWWMTDILGLDQSMTMIMGGAAMSKIIFLLFAVVLVVMLLVESSVFEVKKQDEKVMIKIHTPSVAKWSDYTYAAAVGALTILGTLIFAYGLCYVMRPMLAERYLYPLSAVTFVVVVIECGYVLELLKRLSEKLKKNWIPDVGKLALVLVLAMLLAAGMKNYQSYSAQAGDENQKTTEVLELIGTPEADVQLVSNGVKHLGWTVLYHYFPENEVVNGNCFSTEADRFWYFTPVALTEEDIQGLSAKGYTIWGHGEKQLSQYPFVLYYLERVQTAK